MFWGLIMEPNKRYTQTVEKSFHVSMASLDVSTADDCMVQVMLSYDDRNYLLCSLKKGTVCQVRLDLNFQEGTKIAFTCNGRGHVHLTGYLIPEEDLDLQELEEEEEEEEGNEDDRDNILVGIEKQAKRKASHSPKEGKRAKRVKRKEMAQLSTEDDESFNEKDSDDLNEDDDFVLNEDGYNNSELKNEEYEYEDVSGKKTVKGQWQEKKNRHTEEKRKKKQDEQKLMNGKETKQVKEEQQTNKKKQNKKEKQQELQSIEQGPKKRIMEGGVEVEDTKIGNGVPAKSGKFVTVYYIGRLKNGKKFDATTQGDGFKFRLGKGEVIKGWDIGISGMKMGGKRRITIPPALGYGAKGSPPVIPGNSTLIFDVELRNVH